MKNVTKNIIAGIMVIIISVGCMFIGYNQGVNKVKDFSDNLMEQLYELDADSAGCYSIVDGDSEWTISRIK